MVGKLHRYATGLIRFQTTYSHYFIEPLQSTCNEFCLRLLHFCLLLCAILFPLVYFTSKSSNVLYYHYELNRNMLYDIVPRMAQNRSNSNDIITPNGGGTPLPISFKA